LAWWWAGDCDHARMGISFRSVTSLARTRVGMLGTSPRSVMSLARAWAWSARVSADRRRATLLRGHASGPLRAKPRRKVGPAPGAATKTCVNPRRQGPSTTHCSDPTRTRSFSRDRRGAARVPRVHRGFTAARRRARASGSPWVYRGAARRACLGLTLGLPPSAGGQSRGSSPTRQRSIERYPLSPGGATSHSTCSSAQRGGAEPQVSPTATFSQRNRTHRLPITARPDDPRYRRVERRSAGE
jgi:hypothetical protein